MNRFFMKRITPINLFLCFLPFLVVACSQQTASPTHLSANYERPSFSTPRFAIQKHKQTYSNPNITEGDNMSFVKVEFPVFTTGATQEFRNQLNHYIIHNLFLTNEYRRNTLEESMAAFLNEYKKLYAETRMNGVYQAQTEVSVINNNSELMSLKFSYYQHTAGAHGLYNTVFVNFKPLTSEQLSLEDVLHPEAMERFKEVAEQAFRDMYGIEEDQCLNDKGFSFKEGKFSLPTNFTFMGDNLLLLYNPYEIAPFSKGIIKLEIPKQKIVDLLR